MSALWNFSVCGQKCLLWSSLEKCLHIFLSLNLMGPNAAVGLCSCRLNTHRARHFCPIAPRAVPTSRCRYFFAGVKTVEGRASWRQGFCIFWAHPHSVSWLLHSGCQHSTTYTLMQTSQSGWKVASVWTATVQKVWMLWKSWGEKVLIFVNVSQFEWIFYVGVWMTRWALKMRIPVWTQWECWWLKRFQKSAECTAGNA